ncbi:hypothetical protein GY21_08735 [Cryobacterium roopkundense]|uniref:ABC transporter domain-containing protein n=1 Tax=Cryobacterium roopkundense TaxID=1001240 RepID=A0A099JHM6_9MICO|nr:hypothetical protein GY21_08735 [Cryobacterium roopkundense]
MIEAHSLTKRYGAKTAVDAISFTARPGLVTGFLGPNGAGKTTTMRMIVGLDRPSGGSVTVNGKPYAEHRAPRHQSGLCSTPQRCTPGEAPATTCSRSQRRIAWARIGWTRSSA